MPLAQDPGQAERLFLAGERADPDTLKWAEGHLHRPVIDHWWQTESGWPIAANCMGIEPLPVKPGSPTHPVPGYKVEVLGEGGEQLPAEKEGAVVIRLPLPPGTLCTVWRNDDRFRDT
jgi:propionyl-CoA synthetase